ncbi:MAG: hypothetical protein IKQ71_06965 [Lachnospiraceae bacterium]|nr:hypothetical protein [Lachnospiraceae bacterium]
MNNHYLSDSDAYDYNREIYTFEDKIPVNIYDGRLMIDFSAMPSYVKRTWDI